MEFIEEFCFNCLIAGIDIDNCITRLDDMGYTNVDAKQKGCIATTKICNS